ncbi:transketolase [Mesomycoplasma flocculare]|uniref:transketolase n=1 Tax=Mesomycoplasma flocculare ATCC 27399 TaxID=743971 RepID=A0A0A8E773_MESFC|nr:transketolase [Mesomycoplasma flocculare]AJC49868.1 transketolase [Mesomycoplasma flocculare ATCC 27399]
MTKKNIDKLALNSLKMHGVAAVNKANSGHPGVILSASKMLYALYRDHINFDINDPNWVNRDRFILSAGHASGLLYSLWYSLGILKKQDLENFRQLGSKTPGHPEFGHTLGVEATTGPLGQGIAMGVGIALAQSHLGAKFKEINHYTYILCGDGDLQEGISYEALSLAGHLKLRNLIVLYDSNDVQLDSQLNVVFSENVRQRVESQGLFYQLVQKNDVKLISEAIAKAKAANKPSFIEIKTIIGEGTSKEKTSEVHGAPLGSDILTLKKNLEWEYDDFYLDEEVKSHWQNTLGKRTQLKKQEFKMSKELEEFLQKGQNINLEIDFELPKNQATRNTSGQILDYISKNLPYWIGGSADLSVSTKAKGADGIFTSTNYQGRNLMFGVREFAMAAIANGIALHSVLRPFVSTFFVFADYLKPALRLAAIMKLPVNYIFTHDSLMVGEDGPTHQPVEQLAMLRSVPNLAIYRPGDETELKAAYELALENKHQPCAIILTRQNIKSFDSSKTNFKKGAYLVRKTDSKWALIATGSELGLADQIAKTLNLNLISLSNWQKQPIWDPNYAISIELATTFGWKVHARYNFGNDDFGFSAPGEKILEKIGFTFENLREKIKEIII